MSVSAKSGCLRTPTALRGVALLVLTPAIAFACGSQPPGKTPSGARASCAADSDCVLTNQTGSCCAICPDSPRAVPTLAFDQRKSRCAATSCAAPSERVECPEVAPLAGFRAICKEGTCAAVKR